MNWEKIIEYVYENSEFLTKLLVSWVPTLFFALGVLISTLVGIRRGGRKSVVLLIHSVAIFTLCITLFLLLVDVKAVDTLLLQLINLFTGSETGLQELLDISIECETLKEVILESVLKIAEDMGDISIIFRENGAYILTIIDLVYRIVFGLVLYILYFVLVFILYLIYLLFYNTRRYIKKRNKKFQDGKVESPYLKKRWLGGIIGFSRGLVGGLVTLSFIGSSYFVIAGGTGENEYIDYDFGDPNINLGYDVFTSVGEYGTEGIFKVLNMVKDKNQTPYYLLAADLIFQGGLNDIENNINEDIYFRKEFATYIGFARNTLDLLLKYDDKSIVSSMLSGEFDGNILEESLIIMSNSGFQREFTNLISTFESETYIINIGLSLINSVVANNDVMLDLGSTGEILKILFKSGHLSEDIPYEKQLLNEKNQSNNPDNDKYKLAHLTVNNIIKQEDITNLLGALFTVVSLANDNDINNLIADLDTTLYTIRSLLPYLRNLSILSTTRSKELDPVLKRVYAYAEYNLLSVSEEQVQYDLSRNISMYEDNTSNISWIEEINSLLDVCESGLLLFQNINKMSSKEQEFITIVSNIFDDQNENFNTNIKLVDDIIYNIGSSQILGEVLSTKLVYTTINGYFVETLNVEIPVNLSYTNKFDETGQLVEYGEVYNLLSAIRAIAGNKENFDLINSLFEDDDRFGKIKQVSESLINSKYNNLTVSQYLSKSVLIRAALTGLLTFDNSSGENNISLGDIIYLDETALDSKYLNSENKRYLLSENELLTFFEIAPNFVDIVNEFMSEGEEGEEVNYVTKIVNILKGESVDKVLSSKLVEGTLSNLLVLALETVEDDKDDEGMIVVPNSIIKVSTKTENSEIREIINIIKDDILDIGLFFKDNADYLGIFKSIDEQKINKILDSKIIYYTLSKFMIEDNPLNVKIIVPKNCKTKVAKESIKYIVDKDKLVKFLANIGNIITIGFSEGEKASGIDEKSLIVKVVKNMDNYQEDYILLSTIVYYLCDTIAPEDNSNEDNTTGIKNSDIVIPSTLLEEGKNIADRNYKKTLWNTELMCLLEALEEIFEISKKEVFDINESQLSSININKDMIDKISASMIVSATLYNKMNSSDIIIPYSTLDSKKEYIKQEELKLLFESILDNKKLFDISDEEGININNISGVKHDSINTNVIRNLSNSNILEASMVYAITKTNENGESNIGRSVNLPETYKNHSTKDSLVKNFNNVWLVNNEMTKLADALHVLGVDNLNIKDTDVIVNKFNIDNMNAYYDETKTKTNLEVLMESTIISSTLSKTICDILKGQISENIMYHRSIYNSNKMVESFTVTEIRNLLNGLDELGITNISSIKSNEDSRNTIINENSIYEKIKNDTNLIDHIWASRLLAGVVTTQIKKQTYHPENNPKSVICDHENAYETGIKIYRSIEIKTLLNLLGNGLDVNNIEYQNIPLKDIKSAINNSEGQVDSYILLKTISFNLYGQDERHEGIVIPSQCYNQKNQYINPKDLVSLIDALNALGIENANIEPSTWGTNKTNEQYEKAFDSIIIRATLTSMIDLDTDQSGVNPLTAIYEEHIIVGKDCVTGDYIGIIEKDELVRIIQSFKVLLGDESDNLAYKFNLDNIIGLHYQDKLSEIIKSDLFHIIVSHTLKKIYELYPAQLYPNKQFEEVDLINLDTLIEIENYKIISNDEIKRFLNHISNKSN